MLDKIKSYYAGKCNRGSYFGVLLFCYFLCVCLIVAVQESKIPLYALFIAIPFLYFFMLGAIIQRANSFSNTPWFYGGVFIVSECAAVIRQCLYLNGIDHDFIDGTYFYTRILWIIMCFILLFKPATTIISKEKKCDRGAKKEHLHRMSILPKVKYFFNTYAMQITVVLFLFAALFHECYYRNCLIDDFCFDWPDGFFVILKFLTSGYFAFRTYTIYKKNNQISLICMIFVLMTIVYNPIIKVKFECELWRTINIFTLFVILFDCLYMRKTKNKEDN